MLLKTNCSDLNQDSKPYTPVQSEQTNCPVDRDVSTPGSQTYFVQQVIRLTSHKLCIDQKNDSFDIFAVLAVRYETPNRSEGFFYLLILRHDS